MKNFNVAILNDNELGKELGKKGTSTDFTIYNLKQGENVFSFFEPHQYPDKIQSLANVLALTDSAILSVRQLDRFLGETVIALDLIGRERGLIIFDEYVERDKFAAMTEGTSVEKFIISNRKSGEIYDQLTKHCDVSGADSVDGFRMSIDAYFDVKSVGTVVLGVAMGGGVRIHDELQLFPSDRIVSVRSLQVQDEDVKDAGVGSRVGLALKGVGVEELDRGMVLAKPGSLTVSNEVTLETRISKYYDRKMEPGGSYYLAIGMQYRQSRLVEVKEEGGRRTMRFQMQATAALRKGERVMIVDPGAKVRIFGAGDLI